MAEKFTFFWRKESPFSQHYPCEFYFDTKPISDLKTEVIKFNCAEQYMMWSKAIISGDSDIAKKILAESDPKEQKKLGREIKNFNENEWKKIRIPVITHGNYLKFSQNPDLKNILLETDGTTLVEASPYDQIYGIGLRMDHPDAQDRTKWRGENLLGQALTDLRERFLREN